MPTIAVFFALSDRYLESAKALIEEGHYSTGYYLAGYSVECLLKALICKGVQPTEFPPRDTNKTHYTHSYETLLKTARLQDALRFDTSRFPILNGSYLVLKDWEPAELRYDPTATPEKKARDFVAAIDTPGGFPSWLKQRL